MHGCAESVVETFAVERLSCKDMVAAMFVCTVGSYVGAEAADAIPPRPANNDEDSQSL